MKTKFFSRLTCVVLTLAMLIPCMILIPFQKYYIRGIGSSGMKE